VAEQNNNSDSKVEKSKYTADRGIAGAFEGETVSRRGFMTGAALALGGIAGAAIQLPALGFALGPVLEKQETRPFQDVGSVDDFNTETYVPKVITIVSGVGEAGKTTIYVRKSTDSPVDPQQPFIAISTRCAHLGCPVRYVGAAKQFICPCHGGTYDFDGKVTGGPPVRPLDRFFTKVEGDRVLVGERFSVDSDLKKFEPRDPGGHLASVWQYLYPPRPTT